MAALMTDSPATATVDIEGALAAAGVTWTAVPRGRMMEVTVHTPPGWTGGKAVLASRVLQSIRPNWDAAIIGANVAVLPAEG